VGTYTQTRKAKSEVWSALNSLKGAGWSMAVISGTVNLLALTGAFYMLQVYDRVLLSKSVPTLVALSMLALGLYVFQGALEVARAQLLVRIGGRVDRRLMGSAHSAAMRLALRGRRGVEAHQPVRDVDNVRSFLGGQGPIAILDLPWMPLYVTFVFLLHPMLGIVTLVGAIGLIGITLWTERLAREPTRALVAAATQRSGLVEAATRNAEVLRAMGFGHRALSRFSTSSDRHLAAQEKLSDLTGGFAAVSRVVRLMLQSALLGLGAYFVILGEMSAGAIIACSIAASRAYAPIEIAISNWKGFVAARQSAERLETALHDERAGEQPMELPPPVESLKVERINVAVPDTSQPVVKQVSFELHAGQALALIGQSAAGKSTLARALVGVWETGRGSVRLDGAAIERWSEQQLGRAIGYLPQDVELFEGTIKENISRFDDAATAKEVIAAARGAGVHEMILRLPQGYETRVGERGAGLSAGQRQRVALARALYGAPFLVVLDEPNSNLDAEGEAALTRAIKGVRERGGIVVVIAHRPGVLAAVDLVGIMDRGQLKAFGPRDEVLRRATSQTQTEVAAPDAAPSELAASAPARRKRAHVRPAVSS
jgi:ATP-binding cassette, subfamily C, type I secretion system permease/ATPase